MTDPNNIDLPAYDEEVEDVIDFIENAENDKAKQHYVEKTLHMAFLDGRIDAFEETIEDLTPEGVNAEGILQLFK